MPSLFDRDFHEYDLVDKYATAYQQKYGIPNYNEVEWNSREVQWDKHITKITENVFKGDGGFKTTIDKPKEKKSVSKAEKKEITHNKI